MAWVHPNPGEEIISDHVRQITLSSSGTTGGGQIWKLIDLDDAVNPALSIRNQNIAGTALRVYNGTADILTVVNNGANSGYTTAYHLYQKGPRIFDHLAYSGANDTEKINNALADIRANYPLGATLRLNKNHIEINDTINASHINCLVIEAAGGSGGTLLYANNFDEEKPILDLTGSSSFKLVNLIPAGQPSAGSTPNVGFLIAASATQSSNKGELHGCGSVGSFTVAPLYVYGGSNHAFYSCGFQQQEDGQACAVLTLDNVSSVTSPYQTIATGASNSTSDLLFVGCEFHTVVSTTTRSGVVIRGVNNASFLGGILDGYGSSSTHVQLTTVSGATCAGIAFRNVRFYKDQPGTVAGNVITVNNTVDGLTIDSPLILSGVTNLINASSGAVINGLTLLGDLTAYGFSGTLITTSGSGVTINDGLVQACGLAWTVGSGSFASGVVVNAGAITGTCTALVTQNNVLRIQSGSAATPAISSITDTNTGIVFDGSDVGTLSAGGVEIAKWIGGGLQPKRVVSSGLASNLATGNFTGIGSGGGANWGTSASCTAVSGTEISGTFTVTAGTASTGANPTLIFTFPGGAYSVAPRIQVQLVGGTGAGINVPIGLSTTQTNTTIQTYFTPTVNLTYVFAIFVLG